MVPAFFALLGSTLLWLGSAIKLTLCPLPRVQVLGWCCLPLSVFRCRGCCSLCGHVQMVLVLFLVQAGLFLLCLSVIPPCSRAGSAVHCYRAVRVHHCVPAAGCNLGGSRAGARVPFHPQMAPPPRRQGEGCGVRSVRGWGSLYFCFPSFSTSLFFFMHRCCGQHGCLSSTFSIVILNGTGSLRSAKTTINYVS